VFQITAYEHVGIRVTDAARAIAFYEKLGWHVELNLPEAQANEMVNAAGIYINLILNGAAGTTGNVLQDDPVKRPGVTHAAFVVDDLDELLAMCAREKIRITEGPHMIGARRRVCFIRDPDGTVLEFNELVDGKETTHETL
jgi:lactoylglutathione lyase